MVSLVSCPACSMVNQISCYPRDNILRYQVLGVMLPTIFPGKPGSWFNIKMLSYLYRKSHCGDKMILLPSYLHDGISYTWINWGMGSANERWCYNDVISQWLSPHPEWWYYYTGDMRSLYWIRTLVSSVGSRGSAVPSPVVGGWPEAIGTDQCLS